MPSLKKLLLDYMMIWWSDDLTGKSVIIHLSLGPIFFYHSFSLTWGLLQLMSFLVSQLSSNFFESNKWALKYIREIDRYLMIMIMMGGDDDVG